MTATSTKSKLTFETWRKRQKKTIENLEVVLTVTAYDIARNSATKSVTYTVDVIDPELLGAITGWSVVFDSDADRMTAADDRGAYVLQEGQLDAVALVFNGPVDGNSVRANSIVIGGKTTSSITWLDNQGANVLSIGSGRAEDQFGWRHRLQREDERR